MDGRVARASRHRPSWQLRLHSGGSAPRSGQSQQDASCLPRSADGPERAGECGVAAGSGREGALALVPSSFSEVGGIKGACTTVRGAASVASIHRAAEKGCSRKLSFRCREFSETQFPLLRASRKLGHLSLFALNEPLETLDLPLVYLVDQWLAGQAFFAGYGLYALDEVLFDEPGRRGKDGRREAKAGAALG